MEPWLITAARRRPDRVAVECGEERLTYAELLGRAEALALSHGDAAVIDHPPGLDFAVALHACLLRGVAAVPLDPRLSEAERGQRAGVAGGPGVVLVVHTSGTTSAPKPVRITAANVTANATGSALALGLDPDERWLCPLPLAHVGGLMVLLRSVIYATTAVLAPPPFDAAQLSARLMRGDGTLVSIVPTMLVRLLDAGLREPPRLRRVLLGGGPAGPELMARALAAGVPVVQTYGLSEATSQVTVSEPGDARTAGWPLPGVEVRIAADGEILVSGPVVAGGGVLRTGDLGSLDARGRLTVAGRKANTIVTGGENVAPDEIEDVLIAHPDVADAAVLGRPDPEWGEALVALVVPAPGRPLDAAALRAFCRERLAAFKVPKAFEAVDALPRTASGKLQRGRLPRPL